MNSLALIAWPAARLGDALLSFLPPEALPSALPPSMPAALAQDPVALSAWVSTTAGTLGLEAVAFHVTHPDLGHALRNAGAAVLQVAVSDEPQFLVLLRGRGRRLHLLGPDHVVREVALETVRAALCQSVEAPLGSEIDAMLAQAPNLRANERVRSSLMAERLRHLRVHVGWLVHPPAIGPLRPQWNRSGLSGALARFLVTHAAGYGAWILAWLTVGEDALQGRLDTGWLAAGAMMLVMFVVLRVAADRLQFDISLRLGLLLRQRLFEGALALDAQAVRGEGIGQFLGRISEAQAVEELAVGGGLSSATAVLELAAAFAILAWGAGAWGLAGLLGGTVLVCLAMAARHLRLRRQWTAKRRTLTHALIESMTGHRTRMVQEDRQRWHGGEDQALSAYLAESRRFDATTVWLTAVLPRAWLLAAAIGLGWAFSAGMSNALLAVSLGAILLAFESLRALVQGLPAVAGALVAWDEVKPLLKAAGAEPVMAAGRAANQLAPTDGTETTGTKLEAQGLAFGSATHGRRVLRDISLNIRGGDRVLLEGPSGGGKSTLAALLAGLRRPDQGVLLLNGLDLSTLGPSAWRSQVALAAQFHENHVVSETLAFNLLMGRSWPPTAEDLDEAEALCHEVGLGGLLERMPSGLDQMVGESGWQLSHGERSRIYLLRSLLQRARLVVLDESFAALDPDSLRATLVCVLRRAPALMVIAHP